MTLANNIKDEQIDDNYNQLINSILLKFALFRTKRL
ncbi:hypothetical protein BSPWISOXPB_10103 [uncultured Gammaproteobacteria bacterium]|nr:hypothetical protein BSPWISOXPB_10103 [uncultured Gammaproteobacteria bacterium]